MTQDAVRAIAAQFQVRGEFVTAEPYGSGHINETFVGHYRTNDGDERRYIHQRINDRIFTDVPRLMQNVGRVTRHVRARFPALVPAIVPTRDARDVLKSEDGSWWRTYDFVTGARTHDTIDTPQQAYEAARAFGRFAQALIDLPGDRLYETIPAFHDTNKRFGTLMQAVADDRAGRAAGAAREIEYCRNREPLADALAALRRAGISRECVTHNDTKLNNVMLDDVTGKGVCVIDLDTVMPGLALYDFGDMVRTAATAAAEDERDLSLVDVRVDMFGALARGLPKARVRCSSPKSASISSPPAWFWRSNAASDF